MEQVPTFPRSYDTEEIYFAVDMILESEKQMYIINSYTFLQLIGDVGGFQSALLLVVMTLGMSYNSNNFSRSIVEKYFKEKKKVARKNGLYMPIKIPLYYPVCKPCISTFLSLFCFCKSCKFFSIKRNQILLEKGEQKLKDQLEVTKLLKSTNRSKLILNMLMDDLLEDK